MNLHFAEIAETVASGAHAILLVDQSMRPQPAAIRWKAGTYYTCTIEVRAAPKLHFISYRHRPPHHLVFRRHAEDAFHAPMDVLSLQKLSRCFLEGGVVRYLLEDECFLQLRHVGEYGNDATVVRAEEFLQNEAREKLRLRVLFGRARMAVERDGFHGCVQSD